ncbi:hypothetical protein [Croceicoccus gelatinilyticus]|uniref:hypothetical protein n=1 Tax=Croceicoccus gelatinilyticus TaxID=2835536 RepID=UPI001BCE9FEF|nr:hypothetical protein [Croceicoccus gelatinilyticus]MBS7671346.1 hypothetical protein [Croceicoccus gelatinilyticus]
MSDTNQSFTLDPVSEKFIEAGYSPNEFILDMNGCLSSPPQTEKPWNLPCRLMNFPVIYGPVVVLDGEPIGRVVSASHPLILDHPFVKEVFELLETEPTYVQGSQVKYQNKLMTWYHAVDLVSAGRLDDLLDTLQFTTTKDVVSALAYGLRYGAEKGGHVTTLQARQALERLGIEEIPADAPAVAQYLETGPVNPESINFPGQRDEDFEAWTLIHGIERGYFGYKSRFLRWNAKAKTAQLSML